MSPTTVEVALATNPNQPGSLVVDVFGAGDSHQRLDGVAGIALAQQIGMAVLGLPEPEGTICPKCGLQATLEHFRQSKPCDAYVGRLTALRTRSKRTSVTRAGGRPFRTPPPPAKPRYRIDYMTSTGKDYVVVEAADENAARLKFTLAYGQPIDRITVVGE